MHDEWTFERRGSAPLWWILWAGLGAATAGEVVLFMFMDPSGAHGPQAVGTLPLSQLVVVGSLSVLMFVAAAATKHFRIGGGGFPTALMTWALLKGIAIAGLVVYQLADHHTYYWPFVAAFAIGMALANPARFDREGEAGGEEEG